VEASALPVPAGLTRGRVGVGVPLRLRSDEQLLALFRAGNDDAFAAIHDRYRARLFAYARQMLPGSGHDAEDVLQEVFVSAYRALRADDRRLVLRAWLYRVAHNRCIDLHRRAPAAMAGGAELDKAASANGDPIASAEQRDTLRRLIADLRRLPDQQRSALLMRELSGMSYIELASALGTTVPAVKSLLVRARIGLAQAEQARATACTEIREELVLAHDRGIRPSANVRRHLNDCSACRSFRRRAASIDRALAALAPVAPAAAIVRMLGFGGGGGSAAASSAAAAGAGVAGGGVTACGLFVSGAAHAVTMLAAAAIAIGGTVTLAPSPSPPRHIARRSATAGAATRTSRAAGLPTGPAGRGVSDALAADQTAARELPVSAAGPAGTGAALSPALPVGTGMSMDGGLPLGVGPSVFPGQSTAGGQSPGSPSAGGTTAAGGTPATAAGSSSAAGSPGTNTGTGSGSGVASGSGAASGAASGTSGASGTGTASGTPASAAGSETSTSAGGSTDTSGADYGQTASSDPSSSSADTSSPGQTSSSAAPTSGASTTAATGSVVPASDGFASGVGTSTAVSSGGLQ
jgi:RNA polymerase sigma factor (sigma-70 family)